MKCTQKIHKFEYSENHPFNGNPYPRGSMMNFPYGHTCMCNTVVFEEPPLNDKIQKGSMVDKILISRIDSFKNNIIPNRPLDWEWENQLSRTM